RGHDVCVTAGELTQPPGSCSWQFSARPNRTSTSGNFMKLTTYSDYALRVLMYAGAVGCRLVTIEETARIYGISQAHLMKVVNGLTKAGYLRGVRGRSGGFMLARRPEEINLGAVLRATETDFALVECFTPANQCLISSHC